jgi:3-hydroxymyristoyl/3-hydroxydecanoyl-(acyl carrier protein) dehydratase
VTTTETDLYQRICVRRPYFAFADLATDEPGTASATIPAEVPTAGTEPINLHEFIRHGAILGLCSVASLAPPDERRYYLAQVGTVAWLTPPHQRTISGPLSGYAHGTMISTRRGAADVTAWGDGKPILKLTVEFSVFSEKAFGRMFSHTHRPDLDYTTPDTSPYINGLELEDRTIRDDKTASATVTATPEQCAGHFNGFPAMPVAVIIRAAVELGAYLVNTRETGHLWEPADGDLHGVTQLVPAGRPVTMLAELIHATPTSRLVRVGFTVDGSGIGHITFQYAPTEEGNGQ